MVACFVSGRSNPEFVARLEASTFFRFRLFFPVNSAGKGPDGYEHNRPELYALKL
jgi:hypothetical protein